MVSFINILKIILFILFKWFWHVIWIDDIVSPLIGRQYKNPDSIIMPNCLSLNNNIESRFCALKVVPTVPFAIGSKFWRCVWHTWPTHLVTPTGNIDTPTLPWLRYIRVVIPSHCWNFIDTLLSSNKSPKYTFPRNKELTL